MSVKVLDSFALLAHYHEEPGGIAVRQLLGNAEHESWMAVINLGEVYYKLARLDTLLTSDYFLGEVNKLPISFVDADRTLTLDAAEIKARYALSYADCFAAALARRLDAPVVTGDEEFRKLGDAGVIEVEWIAAKPRTSRR